MARAIQNLFVKASEICRSRATATFFLTLMIEAVTLLFRFGFGLKSTQHTASTVGRLTFGIRIHHGYIGLLMLIILVIPRLRKSSLEPLITVIGTSLFVSDIIHHTILYYVTGSADLDLIYPNY
ncbi:MAG: hypothetical protein PWR01_1943 [Clostridiales bacterium]|jgi:hypothetical protein|nr:hypothetical protein [Clostridiales bacterium]MDN5280870.1 hypothetical protein [Candidatus Ozemobacter sp.]